jgi:hypothetical protein
VNGRSVIGWWGEEKINLIHVMDERGQTTSDMDKRTENIRAWKKKECENQKKKECKN